MGTFRNELIKKAEKFIEDRFDQLPDSSELYAIELANFALSIINDPYGLKEVIITYDRPEWLTDNNIIHALSLYKARKVNGVKYLWDLGKERDDKFYTLTWAKNLLENLNITNLICPSCESNNCLEIKIPMNRCFDCGVEWQNDED